ncbi:MAG: HAD family hydrolase [Proteobacteria bacterium]|nr:HAD family hydrolase [Pseudomonadota bacterium]MBU4471841.1 HAD family hydrolase [Pseudomonadota bacterium]MCG2750621.1 HAD family hydrolase [Desulfobacteraceae bacterium]
MKFKAVIFDMDGTLLDTLEDIAGSVNRVLMKRGFPTHDLNQYRAFIGEGPKILISRALPMEQRATGMVSSCLQAYLDDYRENCAISTTLYEGIPELLDELVHRNIKITILTNKQNDLARLCADLFLSRWHFDRILGLRADVPRKPHPAGALEIADHLGVDPKNILFVGDSDTDMKTAHAGGMFPVGVRWGFASQEVLKSGGAERLIVHPMDLTGLL